MIFKGARRVICALIVSRLWHCADVTLVLPRKRLVQSLIVPYFLYSDIIYSHGLIVLTDFRAFRLTLAGFWASRLVIITIFATACFKNAVLFICSIVFSELDPLV
jgi:hypothetical protein